MTHVNKQIIPLPKRPGDIAILAFFLVNILFITYVVDIEQLIIADGTFHLSHLATSFRRRCYSLVGTDIRPGVAGATCMVEGDNLGRCSVFWTVLHCCHLRL